MASPDFADALKSFAQLLGIIDASGLSFSWFGDPVTNSLTAIPANREQIGNVFSYLLQGATEADQNFPGGMNWQPDSAGPLDIGFVWNPAPAALQVGLGATAAVAGQKMSVLAELFADSNGSVTSELGRIVVQLPVPSFLSSVSVVADAVTPDIQFTIKDTSATPRTRTLDLSKTASAGWDCLRIGLFILQSWAQKQPTGTAIGEFAARLAQHLFPMLGDMSTGAGIQASALVDSATGPTNMGTAPNFAAWGTSVITNNPATVTNALSLLFHIRGLLTGDQNSSLIGSAQSFFIPLMTGPGDQPGAPTSTAVQGPYPPAGTSAGAWIGIKPDTTTGINLVLALRAAGQSGTAEIALVNMGAGGIKIPSITPANWTAINTCLQQQGVAQFGNFPITAKAPSATQWAVTLFSQTITGSGIPGFDGTYALNLVIDQTKGLSFQPSIPAFPLAMPPTAKNALSTILNWVVSAVPQTGSPLQPVAQALMQFTENALMTPPASPTPLLVALAQAAVAALKGETGPLALSFLTDKTVKNNDAVLETALTLGPFDPGQLADSFPVHIGQIGANVQINLTEAPRFHGFGFSFNDLRLGDQSGGGASLIGSLLPNLNKVPGFSLDVAWTNGGTLSVTGSATIPIQQTIGPFDIGSLDVDVRNKSVQVGVDLSFSLGPINVSTQDLGLTIGFDGTGTTPYLQGLGLSMTTSILNLSGLFGKVGTDYVGGAVVDVVDMFQLSAIGGYTKVGSSASLFIFASLVAPLGGAPWMFITGVAGGFGLNRKLPPAMPLNKNPFLAVMSGDLKLGSGGAAAQLQALGAEFAPVAGEFWVAGGIQFISFGLINGKVVVAVSFGNNFSIQILGSASFGISSIAYFEIDIAVTADAQKFLLIASVSPSSYLLDPKIFSLEGDFALGVWHGGPHAGDFLLSIGGYHPYFTKPDYYPTLNRVGVKAHIDLGITINIVVECFFACTPQALMAGASASISASIGPISAGLDVYVDVLIQWDPFFIRADLGVTVWFVFFGRHEIGVELDIHTPPFGGVATIHLFIVSFSFSFGSDLSKPPGPTITQFAAKQLQTSAVESTAGVANVAAFNTGTNTGLLKLAITWGRAGTLQDASSTTQEGTDSKQPILVNAEFVVQIATRLPFSFESQTKSTGQIALLGLTSLALCNKNSKHSTLKLTGSGIDLAIDGMVQDNFPQAEFGDAIAAVQGDGARQSVANLDTAHPSIALTNIASFAYYATQVPATPPAYQGRPEQESEGKERFPLPLTPTPPILRPVRVMASNFQFSAIAAGVSLAPYLAPISSRQAAALAISQAVKAPLQVTQLAATWLRESALGPKHTSVTAPANVATAAVPLSPPRRAEMAGIGLRVLPIRAPAPKAALAIKRLMPALRLNRVTLTPAGGAAGSHTSTSTVTAGQAVHTQISGSLVRSGTLTSGGNQFLRVILLGAGEEPLSDTMLAAGNQTLAMPLGLRSVFLAGEGSDPRPPTAQGIEGHCALLALGRRVFAGPGCLLESHVALEVACKSLDTVPASQILPSAMNATFHFGAPVAGSTLVLKVSPATANPGAAAANVRWRSVDAVLGTVSTIAGPHGVALVMPVTASTAWTLDVDLGVEWRLAGAVVTPSAAAAVTAQLTNQANWNLVDDRFYANPALAASSITLEIVQ